MKGRIRKSIFMVVYNKERKFLILKGILHWKGWEFPKGEIENKESFHKTIKRELKEETGLKPAKITDMKVKGKWKYKKEMPDRPGINGQSYELYAVEVLNKNVKLDKDEHSDYKWLDFKQAYDLLTYKNQKDCLLIVRNFLIKEKYKKFRILDTGKNIFVQGKNQEQNEELMKKFIGKNVVIMHTAAPGSPFTINLTSKEATKETAIFTSKYSQAWKKSKPKQVEVHVFKGKDIYKSKDMKLGTFGVKRFKVMKVKKQELEES